MCSGGTRCPYVEAVGNGPSVRQASATQRTERLLRNATGVIVGITALLFDLDNTLLLTDALESIRPAANVELLKARLEAVGIVDGLAEALSRVASRDGLKLGVVTRSPRRYAALLLAHFYPGLHWDVIVAGREAGRYKPHPDGLEKALAELGVPPQMAAYVGDDSGDMEAAYHAGIMPVLALFKHRQVIEDRHDTLTFPGPIDLSIAEESTIAEDMKVTPAALLWNPDDIEDLVENSDEWVPLVEASGLGRKPKKLRWLPVSFESPLADAFGVTGAALGRYFPRRGGTVILHGAHALSREVALKENPPFTAPDHWIESLSRLTRYMVRHLEVEVVTVIPAKSGKDPRLERILQRIASNPRLQGLNVEFVEDVFEIDNVTNTRSLRAKDKLEHLLSELRVRRPKTVFGRSVLVLDDVVTTGSTFMAAATLLEREGAIDHHFIALAKTVSDATFEVREERFCEHCGSPMIKLQNRVDGSYFWGCSRYPKCDFTRNIVT